MDPTPPFGVQLHISEPGPGSPTWVKIGKVKTLTPPSIEVGSVKSIHSDVEDRTIRYVPGVIEPGTVEIVVEYDATEKVALEAAVGLPKRFKVTYPDAGMQIGDGFISSSGEAELDTEGEEVMTTEITIQASGRWVYAAN